MELKVTTGDITKIEADALIVNLFEGIEKPGGATGAVDSAMGGAILELIRQGEIKGKSNEFTVIHSLGKLPARIVAVAGLGKQSEFTVDSIRKVMAQSCRHLRRLQCKRIATVVHGAGAGGIGPRAAAQAIAEGSLMGLYTFRKHITRAQEYEDVRELTIVEHDRSKQEELEEGCKAGTILAEAANLARDLINEPSNNMTPTILSGIAADIAKKYELDIMVLDRAMMDAEGMGGLLGVSQGSDQPPKLMVLNYKGAKSSEKALCLVGKGITFDSGGISLKPSEHMDSMKGDMSGAAAVLSAMMAIARLKPELNVVAVIPSTENMPGGKALKPGDVIKIFGGKTVEVVNTDAEGRLILADALGYAQKQPLSYIVDVATLTGACKVALGTVCSGVFTNNEKFVEQVIEAGKLAGECMWQLPMYEDYKELNKSDVADIKNTGGRYAGAITAAQFLAEFVGDVPWVHIDIAGTFETDKEKGYLVKGATGVAARTLIMLALALARKS